LRRKLLILDVALIAAAVYAGVRVHSSFQAVKERENAVLARRAAPPAPPQVPALAPVPPVLPVDYADIAQKMLLDKSRNSTVIVETPPAPPPVPVPPLPFYHGQMRLPGEAPLVILSETAGAQHQGIHPGDMIGPFKLLEATSRELAFGWQDKIIRKNVDDLIDHSGASAAASAPAAPRSAQAAAAPPPSPVKAGPGQDLNPDVKACVPNDSYEDGASVDGYRKSVTHSPFGVSCQWVRQK
jgi:hypothetical protein